VVTVHLDPDAILNTLIITSLISVYARNDSWEKCQLRTVSRDIALNFFDFDGKTCVQKKDGCRFFLFVEILAKSLNKLNFLPGQRKNIHKALALGVLQLA
jgi:hypothetical protein